MSTKLWNGLILRNHSLEQAFNILKQLRAPCRRLMERTLVGRYAGAFVFDADLSLNFHEFDRPLLTKSRIGNLIYEAERNERLRDQRRSADWDLVLTVTLCPKGADVLALYRCWNDPGYAEALMQAGFEDYHYQDQTDCSADVTEEEWDQRRDDLLACDDGYTGLNFDLITWGDIRHFGSSITASMMREALPGESYRRGCIASYLSDYDKGKPESLLGSYQYEYYLEHGELDLSAAQRLPAIRLCEDILSLPFLNGKTS